MELTRDVVLYWYGMVWCISYERLEGEVKDSPRRKLPFQRPVFQLNRIATHWSPLLLFANNGGRSCGERVCVYFLIIFITFTGLYYILTCKISWTKREWVCGIANLRYCISSRPHVHLTVSNTRSKTTGSLYPCIEQLNKAGDYNASHSDYRCPVLCRCRYT